MLRVVRSSHEEFESYGIISCIQVTLSVQKVDPVEAIVSPAFANLELRGKLSHNLGTRVSVVDHFDPVLVLLCLRVGKALEHLEEYTDVVAFGNTVTVWIHFESPGEAALGDQWRVRIHDLVVV